MKSKTNNMFRFGFLAIAGVVSMYSCTDTWNDHYEEQPVLTGSGSTLEVLQNNAPDFYNVIKATGYDKELSDGSLYTIWAPKTIDAASAADIKALLDAGRDSLVIQRYIKNHVARYTHSLGSTPEQHIVLMNSKLSSMGTLANPTFKDQTILAGETKACQNGLVHFIDGVNKYVPNLYEAMEDHQRDAEGMSMYKFLEQYNKDTLLVDKSVAGGFNDRGEREYIDAVYRRNNTELNRIKGQIFSEDSSFIFILPSAKAYNERYEFARKHLVFNPDENTDNPNTTDSLSKYYAGKFAMQDLIFSNVVNRNPEDSLVSVNYSPRYSEQHVYYKPTSEGGLLAGLQGEICSNGTIYSVEDYPMSIVDQFFPPIKMTPTAYSMDFSVQDGSTKANPWASERANEAPTSVSRPYMPYKIKYVTDADTVRLDTLDKELPSEKYLNYLYCSPSSSSAASSYAFKIPNTLAAEIDEYEIKVVFLPNWLRNPNAKHEDPTDYLCATRFKAELFCKGDNGKFQATGVTLNADADHSPDGKSIVTKTIDENDILLYSDTVTLTVAEDAKAGNPFKYAYYGRPEAGVILRIATNVTSAQIKNNQYTRDMLISKIIFEPKPKKE